MNRNLLPGQKVARLSRIGYAGQKAAAAFEHEPLPAAGEHAAEEPVAQHLTIGVTGHPTRLPYRLLGGAIEARRPGWARAFRRRLAARCGRCRWWRRMHGRVAYVRAICDASGRAFGAGGVVDASGAMAPHVVIEPEGATASAGEADGHEVPVGAGEPAGGAGPTVGRPGVGSATDHVPRPATATPKTTTTAKTTVTRATASSPSRAKTASAATFALPKTADSNWIAASLALLLLGHPSKLLTKWGLLWQC